MNILKRIALTVVAIGGMFSAYAIWTENPEFIFRLAAMVALLWSAIRIAHEAMGDGE